MYARETEQRVAAVPRATNPIRTLFYERVSAGGVRRDLGGIAHKRRIDRQGYFEVYFVFYA